MAVEEKQALVRRWIEAHNRRNHLAIDEALIAGQASRSDQAGAHTRAAQRCARCAHAPM
jgi:hypothetical protein